MVSVCMATYNGGKYIKEQIESILSQIQPEDEIVISDDGSTDDTLNIISGFHDSRIRVLKHIKSKAKYTFDYTTHNFENALINSRGERIFLADQDDVWLPEKYSIMKEKLEKYDIVLSDCKIVDEKLNIIKESRVNVKNLSPGLWQNLKSNRHVGCCMAFNRCVLDKVLPMPKYGVAQDFWITVYGGMFFSYGYIEKPLILYRRHEGNVSETATESKNSLKVKIGYRIRMIIELINRAGLLRMLRNL